MFIYLDKKDAGYSQKLGMLSLQDNYRRFYVREDLSSLVMSEVVAWLRFVVFDVEKEDQNLPDFFEYVQNLNELQTCQTRLGGDHGKAPQFKPFGVDNEKAVW